LNLLRIGEKKGKKNYCYTFVGLRFFLFWCFFSFVFSHNIFFFWFPNLDPWRICKYIYWLKIFKWNIVRVIWSILSFFLSFFSFFPLLWFEITTINKLTKAIELFAYEETLMMSSKQTEDQDDRLGRREKNNSYYTAQLICVLMSAISKISSRNPDLTPRALVCLAKIVKVLLLLFSFFFSFFK